MEELIKEGIITIIEQNEKEIILKVQKTPNYNLGDLRQKLINYLYNLKGYSDRDVELIKILFNDWNKKD